MVNEAGIIELLNGGEGVRYNCADGNTIQKGAILALFNSRTVSGATLTTDIFAGIANTEKVGGDGSTTIGAWTKGIFDLVTGESISAGDLVCVSGQGIRKMAGGDDISGGRVVGKALEDGTDGQSVQVKVGSMI